MRRGRHWILPGPNATLELRRRAVLKGGFGMATTAALIDLVKSSQEVTKPEPEVEPDSVLHRRGDNGPAVLELQEQLSSTGYWLGTPDGGFGHLTQQAVYAL